MVGKTSEPVFEGKKHDFDFPAQRVDGHKSQLGSALDQSTSECKCDFRQSPKQSELTPQWASTGNWRNNKRHA